jgi:hypothetical protein
VFSAVLTDRRFSLDFILKLPVFHAPAGRAEKPSGKSHKGEGAFRFFLGWLIQTIEIWIAFGMQVLYQSFCCNGLSFGVVSVFKPFVGVSKHQGFAQDIIKGPNPIAGYYL